MTPIWRVLTFDIVQFRLLCFPIDQNLLSEESQSVHTGRLLAAGISWFDIGVRNHMPAGSGRESWQHLSLPETATAV